MKKKKVAQFGDDIEETLRVLKAMEMEHRKVRDKKEIDKAMKLICCTECGDIVSLHMKKPRTCLCGRSSGFYTGETDRSAKISGPCIPLGFACGSFEEALRSQPKTGWGVRFEAFIIPKETESIEVEKKKN